MQVYMRWQTTIVVAATPRTSSHRRRAECRDRKFVIMIELSSPLPETDRRGLQEFMLLQNAGASYWQEGACGRLGIVMA